ncbi:hypothetical protein J2858_002470 [Neorhizobium galegae]|uniref:ABC transporter permease n=1 Tax=Neorhizobium galegae TaxID=399 RepID=UPI001AE21223|nr:ABC transporter permease [Neorhizobium galegae]MBP2549547.1 hypothetical protein [Neorhizobium galegae]
MRALLSGEMLKLIRQPGILFWGFVAVPFCVLLFRLSLEMLVVVRTGRGMPGTVDILSSAAKTLSVSGNSVAHLLFAIGIAGVFFTEYRYATWRHLVPRRGRPHLFAAKFLLCLIWLAAGLGLVVFGDMALNLAVSLLSGRGSSGIVVSVDGGLMLAEAFAVAFFELAVLTAVVSAVTILTRSMIAAVIFAFVLTLTVTLLQLYLALSDTADVLPLPASAAAALRDWLLFHGSAEAGQLGLVILFGWLAAMSALGLVVFLRQELTVE